MGRADDVWAPDQRVVRGGRLRVEHVKGGAGNDAGVERAGQRSIIDHTTARNVNDASPLLDLSERIIAKQPLGVRGERHVQGEKVPGSQSLVKGHEPDAQSVGTLLGRVRIVGDHSHTQSLGAAGDLAANLSESHHGQGLADHRDANILGAIPPARLHRHVRLRHVPGQRAQHRNPVLGGRHRVGGRRVHDEASGLARRRQIDVVNPDTSAPDDLETPRRSLEYLSVDLGGRANDDGVHRLDLFQ
mmetsp:Transcript_560/g.1498  ORF Transcript_560/g.1498 Transcript_560/m.1498 type:complete len:245 (-) Transcript_560:66-800(-)